MKHLTSLIFCLTLFFFSCDDKKVVYNSEDLNVLFIMTDDHAFQALSAYDDKLMNTPHLDRIAYEGMLFNKSFVIP